MLTALLASSVALTAQAQLLNYSTAAFANVAGTYTDIATTGTVFTTANIDLANATSTPAVAVLQPRAGKQYVGFYVYSDAN